MTLIERGGGERSAVTVGADVGRGGRQRAVRCRSSPRLSIPTIPWLYQKKPKMVVRLPRPARSAAGHAVRVHVLDQGHRAVGVGIGCADGAGRNGGGTRCARRLPGARGMEIQSPAPGRADVGRVGAGGGTSARSTGRAGPSGDAGLSRGDGRVGLVVRLAVPLTSDLKMRIDLPGIGRHQATAGPEQQDDHKKQDYPVPRAEKHNSVTSRCWPDKLPAAVAPRDGSAVQRRVGGQSRYRSGEPAPPGDFGASTCTSALNPGSARPASPRPREVMVACSSRPAVRPCRRRLAARAEHRIGKYPASTPPGQIRRWLSAVTDRRRTMRYPAAPGHRLRRAAGSVQNVGGDDAVERNSEPPRPPGTRLQIAVVADEHSPDQADDAGGQRVTRRRVVHRSRPHGPAECLAHRGSGLRPRWRRIVGGNGVIVDDGAGSGLDLGDRASAAAAGSTTPGMSASARRHHQQPAGFRGSSSRSGLSIPAEKVTFDGVVVRFGSRWSPGP